MYIEHMMYGTYVVNTDKMLIAMIARTVLQINEKLIRLILQLIQGVLCNLPYSKFFLDSGNSLNDCIYDAP